MKRMLFGIAMLLFVVWILGFFIFNAGVIIHLFVIVSAIVCMQAIIITSPKPRSGCKSSFDTAASPESYIGHASS